MKVLIQNIMLGGLILVVPHLGISAEPSEIPARVERANESVKMEAEKYCPSCNYSAGVNGPPKKGGNYKVSPEAACYMSICDSPTEKMTWSQFGIKNQAQAKKITVPPEILSKINQVFDQTIQEAEDDYRDAVDAINSVMNGNITKDEMATLGVGAFGSTFQSFMHKYLSDAEMGADGKVRFKFKELGPDEINKEFYNKSTADWFFKSLPVVIEDDRFQSAAGMSFLPLPVYLEIKYPGSSIEEGTRLLAGDALKQFDKAMSSIPNRLLRQFLRKEQQTASYKAVSDLVRKKNKNAVWDSQMSDHIEYIMFMSALMHMMTEVGSQYPNSMPLQDFMKRPGFMQRKEILEKLKDKKYKENLRSKFIAQCSAAYISAYVQAPTQEKLNNYKKIEDQVRSKIKSNVLAQLSTHTQKSVGGRVDKIKIIYPRLEQEERTRFVKNFDETISESLLFQKHRNESPEYRRANGLGEAGSFAFEDRDIATDGYEIEEDLTDICEDNSVEIESDSTYPKFGYIQPSVMSLAGGASSAEGVLGHEFGHVLSQLLSDGGVASGHSREMYKKNIACIASNHPQDKDKYWEEDYADTVAAQIMRDNTENPLCVLVYPETIGILNQGDENDKHSATFYRVLRYENLQGRALSPECQAIVRTQLGKSYKFNRCETK